MTAPVPADGGAATGGRITDVMVENALDRVLRDVGPLPTPLRKILRAGLTAVIPAIWDQARAEGAAEERERNTYRDESGQELHCPRCGGPDPEGYTRQVLDG